MSSLIVVFSAIKEYCNETGPADATCYTQIEKQVAEHSTFALPLYLEVLQAEGLIIFRFPTRGIELTTKGRNADARSAAGINSYALLLLFLLRRVCYFLLLWPLFMFAKEDDVLHKH